MDDQQFSALEPNNQDLDLNLPASSKEEEYNAV
jgi:hypothetical protein